MENNTQVRQEFYETAFEARELSTGAQAVSWYYTLSAVFIVASVIFAGVGLYKLYDNSYSARIVGGDAYNFIIYATRGTAFVCVGIICAVLSVTFALFARAARD